MSIHKLNLATIGTCIIFGLLIFTQPVRADIFTGLEFEVVEPQVNETEPEVLGVADSLEPSQAVELMRLQLDAETIAKGYTVETEAGDFKAGVVAKAVTVPVTVVLKQIPAWHNPAEKTFTKVSAMFDYDIRACRGSVDDCDFAETESLGVLEKPILVAVKFDSDNYKKKVLHYWHKPAQAWVPLSSTTDFDNQLARAEIYFPYARLAVFEDPDIQEGLASWYRFRNCHCAASHVYKRGTQLKVTNISGSARHGNTEIVTVNDYGPDPQIHPDRPIDLDAHVYQHLAASLNSGLMMVRVEPVDVKLAQRY